MALKLQGGKFVMNAGKLSCLCCCPQPVQSLTTLTASIQCQVRSATRSKTGFSEPAGLESTPKKIYRSMSISGSILTIDTPAEYDGEGNFTGCGPCVNGTSGGYCAYAHEYRGTTTFDFDGTKLSDAEHRYGSGTSEEFGCLKCSVNTWGDWASIYWPFLPGEVGAVCDGEGDTVFTVESSTSSSQSGCGCVPAGVTSSGTITFSLSTEYTRADLKVYTIDNLSAWTSGGCSSTFFLTADEVSCAITRNQHRFTLPASAAIEESITMRIRVTKTTTPTGGAPSVEREVIEIPWDGSAMTTDWYALNEPDDPGTIALAVEDASVKVFKFKFNPAGIGTCYRIEWIERYTHIGGAVIDTPREWQWGGSLPEGYDPTDSATWPTSPAYYLTAQDEPGAWSVVDVVASCEGCA